MPLADQELQEFHEVLARMDEAELALMLESAAHEKGRKGEEAMRNHYFKLDWIVYNPPKKLTEPGPDAIVWRRPKEARQDRARLELRILDNKSGQRRSLNCPSGLSTRSLFLNLPDIIKDLTTNRAALVPPKLLIPDKLKPVAVQATNEAIELLKQTWDALRIKGIHAKPLPPGVELWVTNACGRKFGGKQAPLLFFPRQPERPVPVVWLDDIVDQVGKSACASST
jgi:hypothetical protein